ncbi:MAG: hypothetical protein WAN23_01200 [Candidatus Acidiferrales bacterium]
MAATQTSGQAASQTSSAAKHTGESRANPARRAATDDEILGIGQATEDAGASSSAGLKTASAGRESESERDSTAEQRTREETAEPESLRTALDANPELRQAWRDAQAYRETFATPEEARAATALLADLDHMDSLFFSQRPEDHAALARAVASLDPAAFTSLTKAMNGLGTATQRNGENPTGRNGTEQGRVNNEDANAIASTPSAGDGLGRNGATAAQEDFFHATNAAAVQSVLDAIESQVERLLPESASKSARNRVVGEIYRELDNTLRSNRQLAQQMREAFRSGALDADHQRAIVSLISGRARQALPGVAKRVLNEWTSTVVAANQDRRARQRAAERRVDIAGSNGAGNDGRRPTTPGDIDYARMSDADILNL